MSKSLVLFSSGHDSFYCLLKARQENEEVECITFDYGQPNKNELHFSKTVCDQLGIKQHVVHLPSLMKDRNKKKDVSSQYYPGRNLIMLSIATAIAEQINASSVYAGFCSEDSESFPDCRIDFIDQFRAVQTTGYSEIKVITPCIDKKKSETYNELLATPLAEIYLANTYSCYNNSLDLFFSTKGCGVCAACLVNKKEIFDAISK